MHFLTKHIVPFLLCFSLAFSTSIPVYADSLSEKYEAAKEDASEAKEALEKAKDDLNEAQQQLVDIMAQIADMEDTIEETQAALDDAEDQELYQRELMAERMQYAYENNGESLFASILSCGSIEEFLNRIEYITTVYNSDKELEEEYEELVASISEMKETLEAEKVELEDLENELEDLMISLSKTVDLTQSQYDEAAALVEEYQEALAAEAAAAAAEADAEYNSDGSTDIVAYARQFIGYSYKWGGNSLTGGIDCSHFVYQVLKNTGHYSGGYMTSSGWRSAGTSVSASNAQAGDILCYNGHVSIYSGSGTEVHARSTKYGICESTVNWSRVLCVRRFS